MPNTEYRNLTADELEYADHAFEVGDNSKLREFARISAEREHEKEQHMRVWRDE